MRTEPY